jgi:hypothetical protein
MKWTKEGWLSGVGKIKLKGILKEGILYCFAQPAKQSLIIL